MRTKINLPFLVKTYLAFYFAALIWVFIGAVIGDETVLGQISRLLRFGGLAQLKLRIVVAGLALLNFVLFFEVLNQTKIGWYVLIIPHIIAAVIIAMIIARIISGVLQHEIVLTWGKDWKRYSYLLGGFIIELFWLFYFAALRTIFDH